MVQTKLWSAHIGKFKRIKVKIFSQTGPELQLLYWVPNVFISRSSTICTYGKAKIGVACTVIFSILYNIPRFFEVSWIIGSEPDPDWLGEVNLTSGERPQIVMTNLRQDPTYISVYITWMYLVFMYVLPFGGLSVLNLLMFLDVRKEWKQFVRNDLA